MQNAYLDIADKVIRYHKKPLGAKEIMALAADMGIVPPHIFGKTPHKTLQARLSEHILEYRNKSIFYRTSPGRFFLRDLSNSPQVDDKFKVEWHARRRKKDLAQENVLAIPRHILDLNDINGFVDDTSKVLELIDAYGASYTDRKKAELDDSLKQFVTYVLVKKGDKILSYRRGKFSNASNEIMGARSIGFGGHVCDTDSDFLDQSTFGIRNNAARELLEELWLEDIEQKNLHKNESLRLLSFINVDDTDEAKKHIAAVLVYTSTPSFNPKKGELSINDLNWLDITHIPNHIDDFELWSRMILLKLNDASYRINL